MYAQPELEYVFAQNHPSSFERKATDYALVNLYTGITTHIGKQDYAVKFTVRNLLNKTYYDHLSRLQDPSLFDPAINNEGINFVLSLSAKLNI